MDIHRPVAERASDSTREEASSVGGGEYGTSLVGDDGQEVGAPALTGTAIVGHASRISGLGGNVKHPSFVLDIAGLSSACVPFRWRGTGRTLPALPQSGVMDQVMA